MSDDSSGNVVVLKNLKILDAIKKHLAEPECSHSLKDILSEVFSG